MTTTAASESIDGFYAGYFAGKGSNGFAMLILRSGKIVGADPFGVTFDGHYAPKPDGSGYEANITVKLPPGGTTVQGVVSGPAGLTYEVPLALPSNFGDQDFIRIETPLGPVNVRLVKVRSIDV